MSSLVRIDGEVSAMREPITIIEAKTLRLGRGEIRIRAGKDSQSSDVPFVELFEF